MTCEINAHFDIATLISSSIKYTTCSYVSIVCLIIFGILLYQRWLRLFFQRGWTTPSDFPRSCWWLWRKLWAILQHCLNLGRLLDSMTSSQELMCNKSSGIFLLVTSYAAAPTSSSTGASISFLQNGWQQWESLLLSKKQAEFWIW